MLRKYTIVWSVLGVSLMYLAGNIAYKLFHKFHKFTGLLSDVYLILNKSLIVLEIFVTNFMLKKIECLSRGYSICL